MKRKDVQFDRFPTSVATEGGSMLRDPDPPILSDFDERVYNLVVPPDHYLRKVAEVVEWDDFHGELATYYSVDMGRPAESPVLMLKLEYLRYHHNLSDRGVIERAQTDMGFRCFLGIPLEWELPDPSSLCIFRGRLGVTGFRKVFHRVVGAAREYGIVKDRLRIKDATHVIADIAVPNALGLVAQTRDKLLAAAEPFAPLLVEGERVRLDTLREATKNLNPPERLMTRVDQLQDILRWADELTPPQNVEENCPWQKFLAQRELAHKIVYDQTHPEGGDRTRSTTDPDARSGKHGEWFDGYLTDILIDADSQIITAVNVLPGVSGEAADAMELIRQEESAHGNDVQAVSIDGVGFNGPVLRELEDPDGLNVDTYVPTRDEAPAESGLFTPQDFTEDTERGAVTCPAGRTSTSHYRDPRKEATKYRFPASVCRACPLLAACMKEPPRRHGRTVCKSDYQTEHDRARQKTTTAEYAAVRREHHKVERKLGEVMNRHGARRARYRGRWKVCTQQLMACMATNVKRLVRLHCAPNMQISPEA